MTSSDNNIQSLFFEHVRKRVAANLSFVDELAEILSLSRDSTYRRIRGETVLSLDEVKKLADHYKISLDALLMPSAEIASFHYRMVDGKNYTFKDWLKNILENLDLLHTFPKRELIFFAKDIPIFYYFNSPLLASFKMYFWMGSVLRYAEYRNAKFHPDRIPKEYKIMGEKIWKRYTDTPRIEIWSEETLNVTLRQIEFYYDCHLLEDLGYARQLCDEYSLLVNEIRGLAESGFKDKKEQSFDLYKNDLLIADNTILFRMGDQKIVFIPYNTLNILRTVNPTFCQQTDEYLTNLIGKSVKISTTGEKPRNTFFNQMEEKIRVAREKFK